MEQFGIVTRQEEAEFYVVLMATQVSWCFSSVKAVNILIKYVCLKTSNTSP